MSAPSPGAGRDFTELVDLASARLGGVVLAANDDFFAEKENLLKDEAPVWRESEYTDRGKWMDGWETRRRRTPGHDWCLVRLGQPGVVRGVVVDTSYFRGNFPEACWLEGTVAPPDASAETLLADATEWQALLPRVRLAGHTAHRFPVELPFRFTHLRFSIDPDGGVARLRVHGEVAPDPARLIGAADGDPVSEPPCVDLAALENGAAVVLASDMFFGSRHHLILPGPSRGMHDGWETKRRRGPGHDWAIVRLAAHGAIERVIVDTSHFKGNAPGSCRIDVADRAGAPLDDLAESDFPWRPLLPESALAPHDVHTFEDTVLPAGAATHARLRIDPDGGVARLRLFGRVDDVGRRTLGLAHLNALVPREAERALLACLGAPRWAHALAAARPFASEPALFEAAQALAAGLSEDDWRIAFAAHPRIGEARPSGPTHRPTALERHWSSHEQSAAASGDAATRRALADGNRAYEERFGRVFLIAAQGKKPAEILAALEERRHNDPAVEFRIATEEQMKITRQRLLRLLYA
ncbi:MAG: allantoicase [Candidatus Eiseniibacteriota bacterium]